MRPRLIDDTQPRVTDWRRTYAVTDRREKIEARVTELRASRARVGQSRVRLNARVGDQLPLRMGRMSRVGLNQSRLVSHRITVTRLTVMSHYYQQLQVYYVRTARVQTRSDEDTKGKQAGDAWLFCPLICQSITDPHACDDCILLR